MKLKLILLLALTASLPVSLPVSLMAQPSMLDARLGVRPVVTGLTTPIGFAFLGANDLLVIEKTSGMVKRVVDGAVQGVALDLAVNNASERGLLGIALHPDFPSNPGVYLYWTCSAAAPSADSPFFPTETECGDVPAMGADTEDINAVPLLGNRVDRFVWNGSTLTFDENLIKLRAFQSDGAPVPPGQGDGTQPARGNHDGGVIAFGPDGKLYVFIGDLGRRGQLQNLPLGPVSRGEAEPMDDDQFGGPEVDAAHLSGVVLRLNDDGSTPFDNPFVRTNPKMRKVFAYGFRNGFGMAFDPESGDLWAQENGDDSFSEINRVERGMNGGWVQIAGPVTRIAEFREIETTFGARSLQQLRWDPRNIARTRKEALASLFMAGGARYSDPEFSWKWEVAPGGIGFAGGGLGPQFDGDLFVGAATPLLAGGYLFRFDLTGNRRKIAVSDPRLEDRVADNLAKHEGTESESILVGRDFGVVTDIETGPNGNLFVVSLTEGAIYEIFGQ
jgi:aldose sugar dehydrogenase